MSRNLRCRPRISYREIEEPDFDEYVYCDECGDDVYEYCSIHGPLLVLPDDKVPTQTGFPSFVPRAALTIPQEFLHLAHSTIPGAGLGVFATLTLPKGVRLGPYGGQRIQEPTSEYCWQIYDGTNHRRPLCVVDARDPQRSNWMRYVNCSRFWAEQNLVAYQYRGELYYRTIKIIPRMTELLVFYGAEFARALRIDLRLYNKVRAITDLTPMNNQASNKDATSEKRQLVEQIATDIDSPSISNDPKNNREKSDKTDIKQKRQLVEQIATDIEIPSTSNDQNNNREKSVKTDIKHTKDTNNNNKKAELTKQGNDSLIVTQNGPLENNKHTGYASAANITRSTKTLRGEKAYACEVCDKKFTQKGNLISHIRTHTGEKPFACEMCDKKFSQSSHLIGHIRTHTGEKLFACEMCDKKFSQSSHLIGHIRTHTGEKPFACKICDEKFSHKLSLNTHKRVHTGEEKPYACEMCDKKFSQSSDLTTHIRTHTGEKPLACEMCDKKFSVRKTLNNHIRTHTGEKPYACEICDKKFSQRIHLIVHIRTHTGEKPYACEICDKKFSHRSSLNGHIRTHTHRRNLIRHNY